MIPDDAYYPEYYDEIEADLECFCDTCGVILTTIECGFDWRGDLSPPQTCFLCIVEQAKKS